MKEERLSLSLCAHICLPLFICIHFSSSCDDGYGLIGSSTSAKCQKNEQLDYVPTCQGERALYSCIMKFCRSDIRLTKTTAVIARSLKTCHLSIQDESCKGDISKTWHGCSSYQDGVLCANTMTLKVVCTKLVLRHF